MLPPRMIVEMVYASNFWLNSFPTTGGISTTLSPRAIIAGTNIDYNKHCKLEFGQYCQTHEEHDNSMPPVPSALSPAALLATLKVDIFFTVFQLGEF
jgi:hypothetical protein